MVTIHKYTPEFKQEWDALVANSRNATFLLFRGYMDYHSDRFEDFSLLARDVRGRLLAALPANRESETLVSHRGLSYGGWILPARNCNALDMLEIWDALLPFLREQGIRQLVYKPIPHIYHSAPAEEDLYAIFRAGGQLAATLVSSVVDLRNPLPFGRRMKEIARRVLKSDIVFSESDCWDEYWNVLSQMLSSRYETTPVHSLAEIKLLCERFPDNIKLYTATLDGEIIAGTVLYVGPRVVHLQYSAASDRGKELSAVTGLYQWLVDEYKGKANWFDFGTSNEQGGHYVNKGLLRQKCNCGARAIVYNTFTINV